MYLRPCRPKPNSKPTQGDTGADAADSRKEKENPEVSQINNEKNLQRECRKISVKVLLKQTRNEH